MKAKTVIGGIIFVILLTSVVFAFLSPIVLGPLIRFEEGVKVTRIYSLTSDKALGVDYVSLNFTVKAGGIDINFTDDSDLVYKFVFKQDQGVAEPFIENSTMDDMLLVNVFAESGDVKVTFGNNYIYNGTLRVNLGGISAKLSKDSNVSRLDLATVYTGGILVEVSNNASFDHLNIKVNTGGIIMRMQAEALERNSSIFARVEVGGVIIDSIPKGTSLGSRLRASADIGGISLNLGDFIPIKETVNEVEIWTNNYLVAPIKLEIDIFTGLGGSMINQPFFLTFPMGFG